MTGFPLSHFHHPIHNATGFDISLCHFSYVLQYSFSVVFDAGTGVEMFNNFGAAEKGVERVEHDIATTAEAWFACVD